VSAGRNALAGGVPVAGTGPAGGGPPGVRVGPVTLLALITGRVCWRLGWTGANVILLLTWGRDRFADYATATGIATLLGTGLCAGLEKAALKLVPRARRARPYLVRAVVLLTVGLPPLLVGLLALAGAAGLPHVTGLLVAVAALSTVLGANVVLVALQRAVGHPGRDPGNYLALVTAMLTLALLAGPLGLTPTGYTLALTAVTLVFDVALIAALRPALRPGRAAGAAGRRMLRLTGGTAVMMTGYEVTIAGAVSVAFAVLAGSSRHAESAELYLAYSGWQIMAAGTSYLMRVYQPRLSLAQGGAAGAVRRRASRLAAGALALLAGYTLVAGGVAALIGAGVLPRLPHLPLIVAIGGLFAARVPVYLLTAGAAYVLENGDARTLRRAAAGAGCGLVVAAALAVPLVGRFGAVGAAVAFLGYDAAQSAVLLAARGGTRGRSGGGTPGRSGGGAYRSSSGRTGRLLSRIR
jgi:hypothetical protein